MFKRKNKEIQSDEYIQLVKKITELKGEIEELSTVVYGVDTKMRTLRGVVNRKLHPEQEETINKGEKFL